ncbi:protein TIFY 4B-like isoform X1 [Zingiber officinale]|uniref:protein TIFY 4B-like isoform X1 n=1 Tax=Zingiber officinale TaxID=94328 RepID=UPI001C4B12A0|nr:protein TIFY 4B-like isoform X1 [Zingiber officinale]
MSAAEDTVARSPLEKPLAELTEEDIAQLTREDCRRYLKAKGMRRPSWNKSQAIQQVISLKALLEGRPGCNDCPAGGEILRKYVPPRTPPLLAPSPQDSLSPREVGRLLPPPSPYRRRDPIPTPQQSAGSPTSRTSTAVVDHADTAFPENRFLSARTTAELPAAGQMTIFYDGLVNVYDGVACDQRRPSASQAKAVLDLAGSTPSFDGFASPGVAPRFPGHLSSAATGRADHHAADGAVDARAPRETEPDGGTRRNASLKRYLEKRKDRFKGKKVIEGPSYSCTEKMLLSENFRCPNPIDSSDLNMTSLPSTVQHQPPQSPASCAENQVRKDKFLIDLNADGDEDC